MKLCVIYEHDFSGVNEAFQRYVSDQLTDAGHEVVGLWSVPPPQCTPPVVSARDEPWFNSWKQANTLITQANCSIINEADGMVYLGADNVGLVAAAAMGYAYAKSTPIFFLCADFYDERRAADPFSLQAEFLCEHSGGNIVTSVRTILDVVKRLGATRVSFAAD